jgi:hypothetical protein
MTRTAVRRHVDVTDGRLVIRKIVVETPESRQPVQATEQAAASPRDSQRRASRLRNLKPVRNAMRGREIDLS